MAESRGGQCKLGAECVQRWDVGMPRTSASLVGAAGSGRADRGGEPGDIGWGQIVEACERGGGQMGYKDLHFPHVGGWAAGSFWLQGALPSEVSPPSPWYC